MIGSSSGRSFLSRTLIRREAGSDSGENPKGPFGLSTLHEPLEPAIADLVFVHGLGGGSRSTWTKSGDPSLYWPQEWLPKDPGFQDVRILSFGYDSNWDKESTLNLHDFAKSLLGSIQDCPLMPRESNVRTSAEYQASDTREVTSIIFGLTGATDSVGSRWAQHGRPCD